MLTITPAGDGMTTFVLDIIILVVCIPTVITRFVIRSSKGAVGLDDWLMALGLLMTIVWSGFLISYCFSGGGYDPTDPRISPELLAQALKLYFICQSFYCPTTIPIKISICVALLRISGTITVYRWSLYAIMAVATVSGIGSMLGIVLSCTPPSAFWDPPSGTCNAVVNTFAAYFISACSILTDVALAVLPGVMLWNIRLNRSVKVSVAIILGFAAFASCAVIVRLRYLLALMDSQNFLLESGKIAIWTVIELGIGIFAGSAPALRPLLRRLPFVSYHDTDDSMKAGRSHDHVKMKAYQPGAFAESAARREENHVMEDGDSQEYILHNNGKIGIRKDVTIRVESAHDQTEWDEHNRRTG